MQALNITIHAVIIEQLKGALLPIKSHAKGIIDIGDLGGDFRHTKGAIINNFSKDSKGVATIIAIIIQQGLHALFLDAASQWQVHLIKIIVTHIRNIKRFDDLLTVYNFRLIEAARAFVAGIPLI